jgi:hypothetical protein
LAGKLVQNRQHRIYRPVLTNISLRVNYHTEGLTLPM